MSSARTLTFNAEELEAKASYDDFEPGKYTGTLVSIDDAVANTGNTGLKWTFQVLGLNFFTRTWDKGKGAWKLAELLQGLGVEITPGVPVRLSPPQLIGRKAELSIGYERDSEYLTILRVIPSGPGEDATLFDMDDYRADPSDDTMLSDSFASHPSNYKPEITD